MAAPIDKCNFVNEVTHTVSRKRKRKKRSNHKPVTLSPTKRLKKDRVLINQVHTLNKELEKINSNSTLDEKAKKKKSKIIHKKIDELGGLETYQITSKLGEYRHGNTNTATWVAKHLKTCYICTELKGEKIHLLDVGALDLNYKKYFWIKCTAIDLNPQHRKIIKADFLQFQSDECAVYDVLVLSLVINFVGDPLKRGRMLIKAQVLLKQKGYLIIVLPLACLENSRYITANILYEMLQTLGFDITKIHNSKKLRMNTPPK
uniref:25S rRNA (Adenine(2142)-N(1))-methyltransferase-like n=1 Tax=Saccoglossus kowalevskii TaxID=10224 RepID=A0ABM0M529_SACKO|nr:PREDICTED: 25S rRNA (adenine(2142)-N(1))-methyltransferase-like [Saccoglossus kowalevskii]